MYELAGIEEYSGVRARLYASSANDCERVTRTCPIPTDARRSDCPASALIFWTEQVDGLGDDRERLWMLMGSKEDQPRTASAGIKSSDWPGA